MFLKKFEDYHSARFVLIPSSSRIVMCEKKKNSAQLEEEMIKLLDGKKQRMWLTLKSILFKFRSSTPFCNFIASC